MEQLTAGFIYGDDREATVFDTVKLDAIEELIASLQGASYVLVYRFVLSKDQLLDAIPGLVDFKAEGCFERFKAGEAQGLLIHPDSGGHGIDGMQHICNNMIWVQSPWSARQWEQTIGRLARRGQTKPVYVHSLETEESVDQVMRKALTSKLDIAKIFLEHIKEVCE
jgi:hypothetical protein